jgi:hypothetical protein
MQCSALRVNEHLVHMAVIHSLPTIVREHRKQRHVLKYPAAEESPGDRRAQDMQDRAP